ncbi:MAG: hypothetical protein EU542_08135 [Promethearchaeota archaeon]|nr:MAG: hypothetical protein EU542_08135 [Candidatus Lokiarchaeota archaeon]
MNEFVINQFLKLKLENGNTIIYINNKKILQCRYLLLNNPIKNYKESHDLHQNLSIDNQAENLDHSLELDEQEMFEITPETEFWAHASNLQAWYESKYNTQVLHSNLAFPILRKLTIAGDEIAKEVFEKEIISRFRSGDLNVMTFLIKEGYLDHLSIEKSEELYQELNFETYKKLQKRLQEESKNKEGFVI